MAGKLRAVREPRCHPVTPCGIPLALTARVAAAGQGWLRLEYAIAGDIPRLRIPPQAATGRVDGLWKHSCFEAFIRCAGEPGYLELNFSPSGEWAAYAFRAYRVPAPCAVEMPAPRISVRQATDRIELSADVAIEGLWMPGELEVGLSAVIESADGALSYWALAHPSDKPDFHHPESFVLALAMDGA